MDPQMDTLELEKVQFIIPPLPISKRHNLTEVPRTPTYDVSISS